jgi:hypothetical protein
MRTFNLTATVGRKDLSVPMTRGLEEESSVENWGDGLFLVLTLDSSRRSMRLSHLIG